MWDLLLRGALIGLPLGGFVLFLGATHSAVLPGLLRSIGGGVVGFATAVLLLELRRRLFPAGVPASNAVLAGLAVALPEEAAKLLGWLLVVRPAWSLTSTAHPAFGRRGATRRHLSEAAGLGVSFAVLENALYLSAPLGALVVRTLLLPALHGGCTLAAVAGLSSRRVTLRVVLPTVAVLLHLLHNYLLSVGGAPLAVQATPVVVVLGSAVLLHRSAPADH